MESDFALHILLEIYKLLCIEPRCALIGTSTESAFISSFSGGGFRDSLADVAEELCPSSTDAPLPLSFFVRSPNQVSSH